MPLLLVLACACFVGSFSVRMLDPLVPAIASDLATAAANVSLLASAFAVPYALVQLLLGPIGDRIGKARVIKACLFGLLVATALTVVATSIEMMLVARILGGLAGGGIIPLAFAVIGDHVPYTRRQVALSQVLSASIAALLAGTVGTGLLAEVIGWRNVLALATVLVGLVFVLAMVALRPPEPKPTDIPRSAPPGSALATYRAILADPRAIVCYAAVTCEGVLVLGLLPYVATLLGARGAGGILEAGLVLAGFAIGGLVYTLVGSRLIGRMGGVAILVRTGAVVLALGYFGVSWQGAWNVEMAAFVLLGLGFYSIHNSLQTLATELAPHNRGAAVALFAFCFFLGQAAGPLIYAAAFAVFDPSSVIAAAGVAAFCLALLLAGWFAGERITAP